MPILVLQLTKIIQSFQIKIDDTTEFGEVQFYFMIENAQQNLVPYALLSMYSPPDADLLEDSHHALWACSYSGDSDLRIISISSIMSVVSMQPLPKLSADEDDRWFVVEKSGLDDTELTGYTDPISQQSE